jgi:hypothetical protein
MLNELISYISLNFRYMNLFDYDSLEYFLLGYYMLSKQEKTIFEHVETRVGLI